MGVVYSHLGALPQEAEGGNVTREFSMDDKHQVFSRDLLILEEMMAGLDDYLLSESTYWVTTGDLPKLTIGGCLMRLRRLELLVALLSPAERTRFELARQRFHAIIGEQVVRFEHRTHQEMRARLQEWMQDLKGYRLTDKAAYADKVDARVLLADTIGFLQQPPYRLDRRITGELAQLDEHLHRRWQSGDFVWPAVWQAAYPAQTYWWLYGYVVEEPASIRPIAIPA